MTAIIQEHPEQIRFPLMEERTVGFLLALMAGLLNAWTLAHAQTFATVQSGNVVQSGYRLVQGDWQAFVFALGSVLAFGIGSAACGALMTGMLRRKRVFTPVVLGFECAALVGLGVASRLGVIDPHVVAYVVSFVAGAQGNAFHKNHGMLYGNVAVTFVVQMAFNFLVQGVFKKEGINGEPNMMWAGIFFSVLVGFAGGGALGFYIDLRVLDHASLFLAGLLALVLAVRALRQLKRADPTSGGLIG
ncbi:YoaK family protein [Xanthobacter sp. V4C-4]|uniref:YoaK family protein n=1 Tax=Xanthobacter cornucopiae TaxID=3119924 RepID=UPI00372C3EEF